MDQLMISNNIAKTLKVTSMLTVISTVVIILIGISIITIDQDIKKLQSFIKNADNIQENFETSLKLYTESTKDTIDFLLELRPSTEEDFIKFISNLENIGDKLNLDLKINTVADEKEKNILTYEINFFTSVESFQKFLQEIERLSYFIRITNYSYTSLKRIIEQDLGDEENFSITLKLHTK